MKEWTAKIWQKSEARYLPEEMTEGELGRSEQHTRYNADNNEENQNRNRHAAARQSGISQSSPKSTANFRPPVNDLFSDLGANHLGLVDPKSR